MEIKVGNQYRLKEDHECSYPAGAVVIVEEIGVRSVRGGIYYPEWIQISLVEPERYAYPIGHTQVVEDYELERIQ